MVGSFSVGYSRCVALFGCLHGTGWVAGGACWVCDLHAVCGLCFVGLLLVLGLVLWVCFGDFSCCFVLMQRGAGFVD